MKPALWLKRWRRRGLRAHIDHIVPGRSVSGWAMDRRDPTRKIDLEVLLDGQVVGRTAADGYRADLQSVLGGDGRYAFTASIDLSDVRIDEGVITLREAGGEKEIPEVLCSAGFDLEFWRDFLEEYFPEDRQDASIDETLRSLLKERHLEKLLERLRRIEAERELSAAESALYFSAALTLREEGTASAFYLGLLHRQDSRLGILEETLKIYCRPLWLSEETERLTVLQIRRIEFFLTALPRWRSEGVVMETGAPAPLLARMLQGGFLPDDETLEALLSLWKIGGADGMPPAYREAGSLARLLHRGLLTGEVLDPQRWEREREAILVASKREGALFINTLTFILFDLLAFGVQEGCLKSSEIEKWQEAAGVRDSAGLDEPPALDNERKRLLETMRKVVATVPSRFRELSPVRKEPEKSPSTLKRVKEAKTDSHPDSVACFLVQRNEGMRLQGFFDYYRTLGVDRFYVVDNASDDASTLEFLQAQEDVELFATAGSYAQARFGITWIEELLKRYREEGSWNLVVDADELLVLDERFDGLASLCRTLEEGGHDALGVPLLDLYSKGAIRKASYRPGLEILKECGWYDARFYTTFSPYGGPRGEAPIFQGGVRSRCFGIDSVVLNKYPLFRYRPGSTLREGMHWIDGVHARYGEALLLHFKYLSTFHRYAEEEAKRAEHWNGASEYRRYHEALQNNPDFSLYHPALSRRFRGVGHFFDEFPAKIGGVER